MDAKDFAAFAAQNPDALKVAASGLIESATKETHTKAHAEGVAEERDRCKRICALTADASVIKANIESGASAASVKDQIFDAQAKRIADLEAKIASGQTTVADGGQKGVPFVAGTDPVAEPDAKADPEARAAWEYDNNKAAFKAKDKESYIKARVAGLTGRMSLVG